jgi:hypothetical protein
MTNQLTKTPRIRWHLTNEIWYLNCASRRLAVLEPTWDGLGWFVFTVAPNGELNYVSSRRRVSALKTCMTLWARKMLSTSCPR